VTQNSTRALLLIAVPAAALLGLYGRFKGIGTWPLGVDEFYISRSIDHVLTSGLPAFPCGGYYTRGLIFQYLVAALRRFGATPETAGRFVAGIASLAVLPAAFLLGKRISGSLTGWLAVIILFVSIWEIEMARFGRMYAPFQAVFAWYLIFYCRYTVDRDDAALRWMIGLSVIGILTWEGGVLLGLANIYAVVKVRERGRLNAGDWRRLAVLLVLLALLYIASRDLRGPSGAATADVVEQLGASAQPGTVIAWLSALRTQPLWVLAFLLPLIPTVASIPFIMSYRHHWMVFAGLWIVLFAALAHTFTAAAGGLALMLLTNLVDWQDFTTRPGQRYVLALLAFLVFWLAYDQVSGSRSLHSLFGFPDIFERIGRPWARTLPVLTCAIIVSVVFWFLRWVRVPERTPRTVGSCLGLLVLLVLVIGAIPTERIETRYTFFLYPLLIVLAIAAALDVLERSRALRRAPAAVLAAAPMLCFAVTEDFQARQVVHIDDVATNFRIGMTSARADHYYPRNDLRGVAEWLEAHVQPGDLVVSGIPNLDQYYPGFDYFFLDDQDNRLDAYVCPDGRTERWTNHPVLYNAKALKYNVDSGHRVYGTVYSDVEERLRRDATAQGLIMRQVYTARDGKTHIVSIVAAPAAARTN